MSLQAALYFLMWAGAFALMMRYGCGAHVMGHRHKHEGSIGTADPGAYDNVGSSPPD